MSESESERSGVEWPPSECGDAGLHEVVLRQVRHTLLCYHDIGFESYDLQWSGGREEGGKKLVSDVERDEGEEL
jgi:hypothetical protein